MQNSRGIIEADVINWFISISSVLEKFAWDIVLGFSNELNFFTLPDNLTTGSSIMPQKRNPDVAELLRARGAKIKGALTELSWASGKLPSNYHRDLQYTKAPMMRAAREVADSLDMAILLINGLGVNEKRLKECLYPELYATYDAYELVAKGQSFRDAYRIIGEKVKKGGYKKVDSGKYAKFTNNILKELQSEMVLAEEVLQKIGWEIDEMMEVVDGAVKGMVGA